MASACINQLGSTLTRSAEVRWDELELSHLPEDSPLLELRQRLGGWGRIVKVQPSGVCHISNLEGGMDQYLKCLGSDRRRKSNRALRELNDPAFKLEFAETAEEAGIFFDQLVELHRARWAAEGKHGSFAPRHAEFHRSLAVELVPQGQVLLARLSHPGRPLALSYNHQVGGKVDSYQIGIDHSTPVVQSAGASLFLATVSRLTERHVVLFDHLTGFNRFKSDFAKEQRSLSSLRIMRPRIRLAVRAAANVSARAARKAARMIGRRQSAGGNS
jgi:CelD/BcsL family acetyltransferase involved in cellulose biosynthesis